MPLPSYGVCCKIRSRGHRLSIVRHRDLPIPPMLSIQTTPSCARLSRGKRSGTLSSKVYPKSEQSRNRCKSRTVLKDQTLQHKHIIVKESIADRYFYFSMAARKLGADLGSVVSNTPFSFSIGTIVRGCCCSFIPHQSLLLVL